MPICLKHLQQYNENGYCPYCGQPFRVVDSSGTGCGSTRILDEDKDQLCDLADTHAYSKEDLDIKGKTTTTKCCDKCFITYTEHDYPAHTILDACINPNCECHKTCQHEWDYTPLGGFIGNPPVHTTGGEKVCKKCGERE